MHSIKQYALQIGMWMSNLNIDRTQSTCNRLALQDSRIDLLQTRFDPYIAQISSG